MQITDVRVFPVRDDKLKAFVSVVFESCFMVNDIKVINGRDGYFISMPSRRKKNGEFKDIAHPLNSDTRRMLEERILDEYEQVVALDEPPVRRYQKEEESLESEAEKPSRGDGDRDALPAPVAAGESQREQEPEPEPEQESSEGDTPEERETAELAVDSEATETTGDDSESTAESDSDDSKRKDMDEVVETHLSDAFWS